MASIHPAQRGAVGEAIEEKSLFGKIIIREWDYEMLDKERYYWLKEATHNPDIYLHHQESDWRDLPTDVRQDLLLLFARSPRDLNSWVGKWRCPQCGRIRFMDRNLRRGPANICLFCSKENWLKNHRCFSSVSTSLPESDSAFSMASNSARSALVMDEYMARDSINTFSSPLKLDISFDKSETKARYGWSVALSISVGGESVGQIDYEVNTKTKQAFIEDTNIFDEGDRGKGYGTNLVEAALKDMEKKGATVVYASANYNAMAFWHSIGFSEMTYEPDTVYTTIRGTVIDEDLNIMKDLNPKKGRNAGKCPRCGGVVSFHAWCQRCEKMTGPRKNGEYLCNSCGRRCSPDNGGEECDDCAWPGDKKDEQHAYSSPVKCPKCGAEAWLNIDGEYECQRIKCRHKFKPGNVNPLDSVFSAAPAAAFAAAVHEKQRAALYPVGELVLGPLCEICKKTPGGFDGYGTIGGGYARCDTCRRPICYQHCCVCSSCMDYVCDDCVSHCDVCDKRFCDKHFNGHACKTAYSAAVHERQRDAAEPRPASIASMSDVFYTVYSSNDYYLETKNGSGNAVLEWASPTAGFGVSTKNLGVYNTLEEAIRFFQWFIVDKKNPSVFIDAYVKHLDFPIQLAERVYCVREDGTSYIRELFDPLKLDLVKTRVEGLGLEFKAAVHERQRDAASVLPPCIKRPVTDYVRRLHLELGHRINLVSTTNKDAIWLECETCNEYLEAFKAEQDLAEFGVMERHVGHELSCYGEIDPDGRKSTYLFCDDCRREIYGDRNPPEEEKRSYAAVHDKQKKAARPRRGLKGRSCYNCPEPAVYEFEIDHTLYNSCSHDCNIAIADMAFYNLEFHVAPVGDCYMCGRPAHLDYSFTHTNYTACGKPCYTDIAKSVFESEVEAEDSYSAAIHQAQRDATRSIPSPWPDPTADETVLLTCATCNELTENMCVRCGEPICMAHTIRCDRCGNRLCRACFKEFDRWCHICHEWLCDECIVEDKKAHGHIPKSSYSAAVHRKQRSALGPNLRNIFRECAAFDPPVHYGGFLICFKCGKSMELDSMVCPACRTTVPLTAEDFFDAARMADDDKIRSIVRDLWNGLHVDFSCRLKWMRAISMLPPLGSTTRGEYRWSFDRFAPKYQDMLTSSISGKRKFSAAIHPAQRRAARPVDKLYGQWERVWARPDLLKEYGNVPVGDKYYDSTEPLLCRWATKDANDVLVPYKDGDLFQVFFEDEWQETEHSDWVYEEPDEKEYHAALHSLQREATDPLRTFFTVQPKPGRQHAIWYASEGRYLMAELSLNRGNKRRWVIVDLLVNNNILARYRGRNINDPIDLVNMSIKNDEELGKATFDQDFEWVGEPHFVFRDLTANRIEPEEPIYYYDEALEFAKKYLSRGG